MTFTAQVSYKSGTPPNGETVTFTIGSTVLGTATLENGAATFTTSTLPAGTDGIHATYAGDTNFISSTAVVHQIVYK
jgi:Bacterial Ig-like domain (group 3)